jgi:hypothetical protein
VYPVVMFELIKQLVVIFFRIHGFQQESKSVLDLLFRNRLVE